MAVSERSSRLGADILENRDILQGEIGGMGDEPFAISEEHVAEQIVRKQCGIDDVIGRFDDDFVAANAREALE
jgi:hypothetical protein